MIGAMAPRALLLRVLLLAAACSAALASPAPIIAFNNEAQAAVREYLNSNFPDAPG